MNKLCKARAFLVFTTAVFSWSISQAQAPPPGSVSNGAHKVEVTGVEKTRTIMGNIAPRTPGAVFLMFSLATDDPCFHPEKNTSCFNSTVSSLDKSRLACGQVETAAGKVYQADGGGLIGGKLSCGFVVPAETAGTVKLRLKGYPDLSLEVSASLSASGSASPPSAGTSQLPAMLTPKPAPEMERLSKWLAGKWETMEWYQPDPGVPRQQVGTGLKTFTAGPGGLSLLGQYRANRNTGGVFEALSIVYWNPEKKVYESVSCNNARAEGCAIEGSGNWEGGDLVFHSEFEFKGGKVKTKTVYTDIKPESFTYYIEASFDGGPARRSSVISYRKGSEPAASPPRMP